MSHKIILLIAGKKQSGKNTLANRIVADFMNRTKLSKGSPYRYEVDDQGEIFLWNPSGSREKTHISVEAGIATEEFIRQSGVRSMAFATPLKQFCMEVFGLHKKQCYGSDADKNTNTLLYWEDQPFWTRVKYAVVSTAFQCPRRPDDRTRGHAGLRYRHDPSCLPASLDQCRLEHGVTGA
jgi:hypothetical protein